MIPKVYAHSLPGKPASEWQPLDEHLKAVAEKIRVIRSVLRGEYSY